MRTLGLRRFTGVALTIGVLLSLLAVPGGAQQNGTVEISPENQGDLAIDDDQLAEVSGEVAAGEIEAARQIAITYAEPDQDQVVKEYTGEVLNRSPSPFYTEYLQNVNGTLTGQLQPSNAFGPPNPPLRDHDPAQYMVLEVDIAGQTFRSNRLPVDYTMPRFIRAEVISPSEVRVIFDEAVRHDQGDLPTDWDLRSPDRQVLQVRTPNGDCPTLGERYEDVTHRPEITSSGCSRILDIAQPLGEDEQITAEYIIAEGGTLTRPAHTDFASNEAWWDDQIIDPQRAVDLIRPALPEMTEVNGEAPGGDAAVSARDEAPTVTADNISEGHEARAIATRGGQTVAQSPIQDGDGGPLTFQLSALPEPDSYDVTVEVTDPSGNKSTDEDKNGPGDDGDPHEVAYTLLSNVLDPPTVARINGETPTDGTVLGNEPEPSVEVSNVRDGDRVTVHVESRDGSIQRDSDPVMADGSSVTVQLEELPEDGLYDVTATREDLSCDDCAASGPSEVVVYDLDQVQPTVTSAVTDDGSQVVVRFSEPVLGDDVAAQWTFTEGGGAVTAVEGEGDRRTLAITGDVDPGDVLRWQPLRPLVDDYHDEHGNFLDQFTVEIDAIERLPDPPTIDTVAGQQSGGTDSAGRPVYYFNDPSPTVTASGLHEDDVAVLYRDVGQDGDTSNDAQVGTSDAAGDDGEATVQYSGDDLDPGRYLFHTRARTSNGDLSPPSGAVAYDLDVTPPTSVGEARLEGAQVQVEFSEPVFGANRAAQWRLGDGSTVVTGVSGPDGTVTRTLSLATAPDPDTHIEYRPGTQDAAYRDRHFNRTSDQNWALVVEPIVDVPNPPDVVAISGAEQQEGSGDSWLGSDATPQVEIETDEAGREVELYHDRNRDGTGQSGESLGTATSSSGITGPPSASIDVGSRLPEGTVPLLAVARSDSATSQPDRVSLVLDLTPPRPVAAVTSGNRITVLFTEPIFGRNIAADWSVSQGGPVTSVSVGGSQSERILETSGDVPAGATVSYDPAEQGTLPFTGPEGEPYHDRVGHRLDAFTRTVTETFPPVVDILDGTLSGGVEGDSGVRDAVFELTLDRTPEQDVRVGWSTVDGSAEGGSDYRTGSGTVRIPAGQRSGRITVEVLGDQTVEDDEFFRVRLTTVENATIGRDVAGVTIVDDDELVPAGGPGDPDGSDDQGLSVHRLGGADRIETAIEISKAGFDAAATVVLARADLYPDALAGAPLAAAEDAPILLTGGGALDPRVAAELDRLGTERVILLGGTAALAEQVARDARADGLAVERVAGVDRFDTARLVAARLGTGGAGTYLVQGVDPDPSRGWPDAVSVSPLAAHQQRPILLTATSTLPGPTRQALDAIRPDDVTIVGGTAVVSGAVAAEVDRIAARVDRLAGADRYATSSAVADRAVLTGVKRSTVWTATGLDWPDSLTAAPAVARLGGVFHLVHGRDLAASSATRNWVRGNAGAIDVLVVLGGVKAVEPDVVEGIRNLVE